MFQNGRMMLGGGWGAGEGSAGGLHAGPPPGGGQAPPLQAVNRYGRLQANLKFPGNQRRILELTQGISGAYRQKARIGRWQRDKTSAVLIDRLGWVAGQFGTCQEYAAAVAGPLSASVVF